MADHDELLMELAINAKHLRSLSSLSAMPPALRQQAELVEKARDAITAARAEIERLREALSALHGETLRQMKRDGKKIATRGPGKELFDRVEAALKATAQPGVAAGVMVRGPGVVGGGSTASQQEASDG
jgi:hypothetical protein